MCVQELERRMERLQEPAASLAALQDFQRRMSALRGVTLQDARLRHAVERFSERQWGDIAADLRHTVRQACRGGGCCGLLAPAPSPAVLP
jgi:hypothetical protein